MKVIIDFFLLLFIILYLSCVFVGRTIIVWRKIKRFPISYGNTDSAHDFLGKVFALLIALSIVSPITFLTIKGLYQYLMPLNLFELTSFKIFGIILAYLSMYWTIIAQRQMGDSWQIGINRDKEAKLVQNGLFAISRHPIYLGVMTTSFSLFLILPNVLNMIVLLITLVTIMTQVRLEEEYLVGTYGDQYLQYMKRTPRWFKVRLLKKLNGSAF